MSLGKRSPSRADTRKAKAAEKKEKTASRAGRSASKTAAGANNSRLRDGTGTSRTGARDASMAAGIKSLAATLAGKVGLGGSGNGPGSGSGSSRSRSLARGRAPSEVKPPRTLREVAGGKAFRAAVIMFVVVAAGGGVGAGARGFWNWMTHSPRFAIREIVVRTEDKVSEAEVVRLANLNLGDNIFSFHLRECVDAIEIHPWVRRASVMRELPDRVIVEVSERKPVALVGLTSLYYVDEEGEVFKKVLPGERMDYPVFTGITLRDLVEDKDSVEPLIGLGLEVLDVAESSVIFSPDHMSEVHLDRAYGATLVRVSDGLRVRVGRGDLAKKWERLEHALMELGSESAKVAELDLNFEGRVTVRLRDGYRVASQERGPSEN